MTAFTVSLPEKPGARWMVEKGGLKVFNRN